MSQKVLLHTVLQWLEDNNWKYLSGDFKNTTSSIQVACTICGDIRRFSFTARKRFKCLCKGIILTAFQKEVLTGILLGDAHLERRKDTYNTTLVVSHCLEDKVYTILLAEIFKDLISICGIKEAQTYDKRTKKFYYRCGFKTRSLRALNVFYESWYRNKVKIIPKNLHLTPAVMAFWVADDGHVFYGGKYKNGSKNICYTSIYLKLSTQSFTEQENLYLKDILNTRYGEGFKLYKDGNKFLLLCTRSNITKNILRDIDTDFPLERKAMLWRKSEVKLSVLSNDYPKCPACGNGSVYKNGHDKYGRQKFYCLKCKKQYTGSIEEIFVH